MDNALIRTDISQIPSHVTKNQYLSIRKILETTRYSNGKQANFFRDRNILLLDLCWETGGRIADICNMTTSMVNFNQKDIRLYTKKRKKDVIIKPTDSLLLDLANFIRNYSITDKIIGLTRQRAWQLVKSWGNDIGIKLHPHMFRHGNALFLMGKVPTPVISARLGHANTSITMSLYQKVTPEIQKEFMKNIEFR